MPDLKFDGSFFFSANNPSKGGHPLLVPDLNLIQDLINGDLKIAEKIMKPILDPIILAMTSNPLIVDTISSINNLEKGNKDAVSNFLLQQYIPKDMGIKPIEKTIITSMMESFKPVMEFLKFFLQTLGIAEDIFCRFLGSSIKVLGKDIGFKSRSPFYWDENLGYAQTINFTLKQLLETSNKAEEIFNNSMSDSNPIKNNISKEVKDTPQGTVDLPAIYVAYFDEDGNLVDPPKWIKSSNKWISNTFKDRGGNDITISSPFPQLSPELNQGVAQLRDLQQSAITSIQNEKEELIKSIDDRIKTAELLQNPVAKNNEIQSLNAEKLQTIKLLDDLTQTIRDVLEGGNVSGNNLVDDNDVNKGVNPPLLINEWIAKTRGAQLRMKYYAEQQTTVQNLLDNEGKSKEPYIFIPKFGVNYNGAFYNIEVPLAFQNQVSQSKNYSYSDFYDTRQIEIDKLQRRPFSIVNQIKSLDINPDNERKPFERNNRTHFTHDIEDNYIPDAIKNFYLPLEWEEVLEFEVRNKATNQVLRTETQFIPFKIDIENDYELRVIKIVNLPLINRDGANNINNFFPEQDTIIFIKDNTIQFIKVDSTTKTQFTLTTNNNIFTHNTNYVNENYFKPNEYFFLRKNLDWNSDKIDEDDTEIYQINTINKNYKDETLTMGKDEHLLINNDTKTIQINKPNTIPSYLPEYIFGNNFIIKSGKNINIEIKITNVNKISDTSLTLIYEGELISEDITKNTFNYSFLNNTNVEIFQEFLTTNFDAFLIKVTNIDYLPTPIKNGDNHIIIQGLNKDSLLSTLSNKILNRDNISQITKPNSEADNIYEIIKKEKIKTRKGIEINSIKLDFNIPVNFNKTYSSDINLGFFYPIKFYTVPTVNKDGSLNATLNIETDTGTVYTQNNNIPKQLNLTDFNSIKHSTDDIDEANLLKEGIIFQGLDPRYVDRNKFKVFYLVEALKKDNSGKAPLNAKFNPNENQNDKPTPDRSSIGGGKEWYGLMDKFTAVPLIATKLIPIIVAKIIPLAIKIIQLISNPTKIKDLLLQIGLTDENVSKFPKNFTPFSQSGFLGKEKELSKKKPAKNFDEYKNTKSNDTNEQKHSYSGPQIGVDNPKPIFPLDGQALAEFGKGAFGRSLFSFGVELNAGEIKTITKKKENPDQNKPAKTKEQPIFNMILNFVKLPFEIIFKIFKFIIDWIKKLLNPTKIPAAIAEFISFKWLLDILGKKSIFEILGLQDLDNSKLSNLTDKIGDQKIFDDVLKTLRGNDLGFVEVLIYDILLNGKKIKQETIERPFTGNNVSDQNIKNPDGSSNAPLSDINNNLNSNNNNNMDNLCGGRDFSIADLLPIPFFVSDIKFTKCELPVIFLKPLEIILGMLKLIQEFLNGFLSIPISLFGLEPSITVPKFGKEIPFANVLEDIINKLKESIKQIQTT